MKQARSRPQGTRSRTARSSRAGGKASIRIVLADSQAIDRGGLAGLLQGERDFEVVGEAATVPEAIAQCRALRPHVLVLSLNLSGQEQSMAIPAIRSELPALRILALSERGESNCLVLNPPSRARLPERVQTPCPFGVDCLQLAASQGAMGTLRRSADPEELFRAIRAVAGGHAWYDRHTADAMLGAASPPERPQLTERELEVASLIAEGQSNKEISTSLRVSEPTVKKHVGHILAKLGLQDRLQAGLFLARHPVLFRR